MQFHYENRSTAGEASAGEASLTVTFTLPLLENLRTNIGNQTNIYTNSNPDYN